MKNLMAGLTVLRFCITSICLALCLCVMSQATDDPSLVLYFDFENGEGKLSTVWGHLKSQY